MAGGEMTSTAGLMVHERLAAACRPTFPRRRVLTRLIKGVNFCARFIGEIISPRSPFHGRVLRQPAESGLEGQPNGYPRGFGNQTDPCGFTYDAAPETLQNRGGMH